MDERSWWLALGAVMLLALVVTLVDGWGRSGRRPRGAARPDGTGGERPAPGEIWWTREPPQRPEGPPDPRAPEAPGTPDGRAVPDEPAPEGGRDAAGRTHEEEDGEVHGEEQGAGHEAPCVVLSVRGEHARVVRITGRRDAARSGVIALPPGAVPGAGGRAGFVETDEPRAVSLRRFRRRAGVVDPALWDQIRHLTDPGRH